MKIQCNGQVSVLTDEQLEELMSFLQAADNLLFGICYYTSCRISEALQLTKKDIVGDRLLRQLTFLHDNFIAHSPY